MQDEEDGEDDEGREIDEEVFGGVSSDDEVVLSGGACTFQSSVERVLRLLIYYKGEGKGNGWD